MADERSTRPSLLVRVRDARDNQAWSQFVAIYAPLVYGFARRRGLQDADAADLAQEVLRRVAGAVRGLEYDPDRGTFRGWLFTVVGNELRKFAQKQQRPGRGTGDTDALHRLAAQPAPEENHSAEWDDEYERRLFSYAAEQVRGDFQESTWQAFWRTAVEGQAAKPVAEALGLTVAAVYLAKGRVMARLKEQVRMLQGE